MKSSLLLKILQGISRRY